MDLPLLDALSKGTVFGLAAGFSPGPLTLLVISETLRYGLRAGMKVSLAPVLTDVPIIALAAVLLERLPSHPAVFGVIALLGAGFLFHLGIVSLKPQAVTMADEELAPHSLTKGMVANFLNPNPYVFWISVGTPILITAFNRSWVHAAVFAAAFFFFIVGSKLLLARIVDGSRAFLSSSVYRWILRVLGILLVVYALMFLRDGLTRIGLLV
jgi:threonine/homoserine/homoserine lactone efflux protein